MIAPLDVTFPVGGDRCAAWLYLPRGRPAPIVIAAHGLGGVRRMGLPAYAERFCAAGYACLVFDYRTFGDSTGEPREWLDVRRQLEDWAGAIAYARSRGDVDSERLVLWGTSLAGGHVIVTAAHDPKVTAVIAQCPFTDGVASAAALGVRSSARVAYLAFRDLGSIAKGRRPIRVLTTGAPGTAALMTAPDARPGYESLIPDGVVVPDQVPARVALRIPTYRPGRLAAQVRCPILFCICDVDTVAPASAALRHAAKAPRGEVRRYPYRHFDIYSGAPFDRVVDDQVAFLEAHVPLG